MAQIHPTAIVEDGARLADDVVIGPYSVVGADVELAEGVRLESHVVVGGWTRIGPGSHVFPFASLGLKPQDLKYKGERTRLDIGARAIIREHVTMNPGSEGGGGVTTVGDDCVFMVGTHIAHDCHVGDRVIMANNATLGGHVQVGDFVVFGGLTAVHQFVRIGGGAMIGGMSGVERDVIPYGMVIGDRARLTGLNLVGLKRRGVSREEVRRLRTAYDALFQGDGPLQDRIETVARDYGDMPRILEILDFIRADTSRQICLPADG